MVVPMTGMEAAQMIGETKVIQVTGEGQEVAVHMEWDVGVQVVVMEADQMIGETTTIQAAVVEDQGVKMVQGAEVKTAHLVAEVVAVPQEPEGAARPHGAQKMAAIVEVGERALLQKAAVVHPEMQGEQGKGKVVLPQAANEIPANPAKKNRAPALFFLFINF